MLLYNYNVVSIDILCIKPQKRDFNDLTTSAQACLIKKIFTTLWNRNKACEVQFPQLYYFRFKKYSIKYVHSVITKFQYNTDKYERCDN